MSRFSASVLLLFIMAWQLWPFEMIAGVTDTRDANMILLVQRQLQNTPSTWKRGDPCDSEWVGISCIGSRITALYLSSTNVTGQLPIEIGLLSALQILDLSYNPGLTGSIPSSLGNLQHLQTLILIGCSFNGRIPPELGKLQRLVTLDVNSNGLSGSIPAPLGNLTNLYWFDFGNNSIGGQLPVELKGLVNCGHFHFNKNQLKGPIPPEIFHENMNLVHVLLDHNLISGEIPSTLGNVSSLEIVRLDRNSFEGQTPFSIQKLGKLSSLNLSHNQLTGSLPDLSGMSKLEYLDLSHNPFEPSEVPTWLSTLESLNTIMMENSSLNGQLPSEVFSVPRLERVILSHNSIEGSLQIDATFSQQMQLIDVQYNNITSFLSGSSYRNTLLLKGNPVCDSPTLARNLCQAEADEQTPYQTDMTQCGNHVTCPQGFLKVDPLSCECTAAYEGVMVFKAPSFSSSANTTRFHELENSLWTQLNLTKGSVHISYKSFDSNGYLNIEVRLFPPPGKKYFERLQLVKVLYALSNHNYVPPLGFGPYYFISPELYNFLDEGSKNLSSGPIIGIAIGALVSFFAIIALGIYAFLQRKKAERAVELSNPFASWGRGSRRDSGDAPKLKGARSFPFQELKMATNNFSKDNEIGSGGYGKVYKGILPDDGQMVAVKRAKKVSNQGIAEFKTELELLSRVHHKNLVGLIGFCFGEGYEQMLVYEYMPNGSLRDNLSGETRNRLDWWKRCNIALGSARGLAYLHEHADPPIIHRDVKSTNILLDDNMIAKVADFGISKLSEDTGSRAHVSTQVKGTMGYLDPEYFMTHQLTQKSDVYSFGVVLMEILSSRQPLVERGKYLVQDVKTAMDSGGINAVRRQILDPFLRDSPISDTVFERFVRISLRCVEDSPVKRPKMSDVVKEVELIVEPVGGPDDMMPTETEEHESPTAFLQKAYHPYNYPDESLTSSPPFDYSGGFSGTPPIEPK